MRDTHTQESFRGRAPLKGGALCSAQVLHRPRRRLAGKGEAQVSPADQRAIYAPIRVDEIRESTDNLLQAAHRTTDYMYIDTGVENSSLYRAATDR